MSDAAIQDIVTEARQSFDLSARLNSRPYRTKSLTVYTDDVTGELLGDDRIENETGQFGIKVGEKRVRTGVIGELAALREAKEPDERAIKKLEAERDRLREVLESTALVFNLHGVPPVIAESAKRKARAKLNIKGKIEDEQTLENFRDAHNAFLLSLTTESIESKADNAINIGLDYDGAVEVRNLLSRSEYSRLDEALASILFDATVGEAVTADADF